MYNNTHDLEVGNDYYNLKTGEYVFTLIYNGDDDERITVEGVPASRTESYSGSTWEADIFAYNKNTWKLFDEDDLCDACCDVLVNKARLDAINTTKQVLMNLWEESGIKEPFIVEDGVFSVGKEAVLSAHINAGYEHGWISSSICW